MAGGWLDILRRSLGWPQKPLTLLDEQKTLLGTPTFTLTIGSETLGPHLLAYHYEEVSEERGYLVVWLDNRDDRFDDLASDFPTLTRGAAVILSRGLVIDGVATVEPLPQCWVEALEYTEEGALMVTCVDWWGLLEGWRYVDTAEFSSSTHSTIAASILGEVGLTLAAGSFGYSTDFSVSRFLDGDEALQDLMAECHETLYSGLAGEVKFKQPLPAEASGYTYDFQNGTAEHPLLPESRSEEGTARFNKVTVVGGNNLQFAGSATNTDEVTLIGHTRLLTVENGTLGSNAECTEQAEATLYHEQAQEVAAVLVARPHFTLEMYDVVTVAAPPWGGPAIVGRVIEIVEDYDIRENVIVYEQEITLGSVFAFALESEQDTRRRRRRRRRRRKSRRRNRRRRRRSERSRQTSGSGSTASDPGLTPLGGIIMWSGATIPTNWALCDGSNGTPDLRDRFIIGSGSTYNIGDTGGAATANLEHSHADGTLAADNDTHGHNDTLAVANDTHGHNDSLAVANDSHDHPVAFDTGVDSAGPAAFKEGGGATSVSWFGHHHALSGSTDSDSHGHNLNGSVDNDTHGHNLNGAVSNDTHGHAVSGSTANAGSTTQAILPPFYSLAFIMRIS